MFSVLTEFILPEIPKIQLFSAFLEIVFWICILRYFSDILDEFSAFYDTLSLLLLLTMSMGSDFFLKEGRFTHECLNACLSVCRPIRVLLEYVVLEMFSMWRWFGRRALKSPPLLSVCSSPYVCHRLRNNTAVGIRCKIKTS